MIKDLRVLIIDDHTMFRQALIAVLMEQAHTSAISCDCADSVDAARKLLAKNRYNIIILDISMPMTSGIDYLPELTTQYPTTPVLMLSMYAEEQFALQAFRLGARGYLSKKETADELFVAINQLIEGERYLSKPFSGTILNQFLNQGSTEEPDHLKLSKREMEIFKKLAKGQMLNKIANELGLSIKSISTYKTRLCYKMGFKNNVDIISYAISHNIV